MYWFGMPKAHPTSVTAFLGLPHMPSYHQTLEYAFNALFTSAHRQVGVLTACMAGLKRRSGRRTTQAARDVLNCFPSINPVPTSIFATKTARPERLPPNRFFHSPLYTGFGFLVRFTRTLTLSSLGMGMTARLYFSCWIAATFIR